MAEAEEEGGALHPAANRLEFDQQNVVSTGETSESDNEDMFSASDEDIEDDAKGKSSRDSSVLKEDQDSEGGSNVRSNRGKKDSDVLFYDENLDEEDEAYVYKHMRGGISENVNVTISTGSNKESASNGRKLGNLESDTDGTFGSESADETRTKQQQTLPMLKPRHSDAVLSCPCCFNIVCMDCQKHKRYANQYRAMFVMGVVVDWRHILVYDEQHKALVSKIEEGAIIEEQDESQEWQTNGESYEGSTILKAKDGEYYAVECAACRTQVAALDMRDEVYYFHGCLESSSAF